MYKRQPFSLRGELIASIAVLIRRPTMSSEEDCFIQMCIRDSFSGAEFFTDGSGFSVMEISPCCKWMPSEI